HRAEHVGRGIGEGDLLIADMANREDLVDLELLDRIDHPRRISRCSGHAGALQSLRPAFRPSTVGFVGRSDHVDDPGDETERDHYDEAPGRDRRDVVDAPTDQRADDNAGDQLRRKPETERHRRCSGCAASSSELVSPDVAAAPNFGQPLIQTSEPCGKRGFVGRRFVVIPLFAAVRAFSHAVETRNEAAWMEKTPRHPQKPRGPYLARQTKSRLRLNRLGHCFHLAYPACRERPVEQSSHCSSLAPYYIGNGARFPHWTQISRLSRRCAASILAPSRRVCWDDRKP